MAQRRSGGPQTPEGKAVISTNALKHGLRSVRPVLDGIESEEEWQSHRQGVVGDFAPEGYLETIPDLVVEVVSKNDTRNYLARKVNDYLRAGVRVVWIVDPASQTLVEHRASSEPTVHDANAVVELPELIPGFQLCVADVFRV